MTSTIMDTSDSKNVFLEAYKELSEPIFRHCFIRVSDREKAKDITQETFIRVWKYLQGGEKINNTKAFVFKIANNLIIDNYRKKKTDSLDLMKESGFEIVGDEPGAVRLSAEIRNALETIHKIEPKYKEVLIMRFVDDLTIGEIAGILKETENSISVRIHRGINKLKELLF